MKIKLPIKPLTATNNSNEFSPNKILVKKVKNLRKNKRFVKKRKFNKAKLPHPITFYRNLSIDLKGSGVWRIAKCPFHSDNHASMGVNTSHGGFICHACGQSGNMLSFYMNLKHVDFVTACTELNLWEKD